MKTKRQPAPKNGSPLPLPTQHQLELTLGLPTYKTPEIRRFLRRVDGMEDIARRTAETLAKADGAIIVPRVTPELLREALARIAELRPIEEGLYPYYRRAYENRLAQDSAVMSSVLKVWRVVQASGDEALIARFRFLGDWIARHHARGPRAAAPAPVPPPANNGGPTG